MYHLLLLIIISYRYVMNTEQKVILVEVESLKAIL
jgi:hypothetical protein